MPPQEYLAFTPDKSSPALISHTGSSDRAHESTIPGNGEYDIVDRSHISGSHSNLSQWVASSPQPSAASEQMVSVVQLARYLHSLMVSEQSRKKSKVFMFTFYVYFLCSLVMNKYDNGSKHT